MPRRGRYGALNCDHPQAAGVCDRGGEVRKHCEMMKEMQWAGRDLIWNGMLCCAEHIDKPHPQDQQYVLRPDPVPIKNARPVLLMVPKDGFLADGTPVGMEAGSVITGADGMRPILTKKFPE
jgi:hypothetical protein